MSAPADSAPDDCLRLELLFGKAVVTAEDVDLCAWARLAELRAEIPGRRFPFDLGSEPDRFRGTRAVATAFTLDIDGARLARAVASAARGLDAFNEVSLELLEDEVRLAVEPGPGAPGAGARVISRLALVPDLTGDQALHLVAFEHLVLGDPGVPAALVFENAARALAQVPELTALVSELQPRVSRDGITVQALRLTLAEAFVRRRWKMPGAERLRWSSVSVAPGRATLRAAVADPAESVAHAEPRNRRAAVAGLEMRAEAEAPEAALFAGDAPGAAGGYRALAARYPGHAFLRDRLTDALLGTDDTAALRAHALETLRSAPDDAVALSAVVAANLRDNDHDSALAALGRLADALGRSGRDDDRVDTLLWAARVAAAHSPASGSAWVDRALRLAPRSPAVLRQRVKLARAVGDADAYEDGLSRLLSLARTRAARARLHHELGRVARDRRNDLEGARVHLQEAAILTDSAPAVLFDLGATCEAAGRGVDAVRAYRGAAEKLEREAAAPAYRAAARVWERVLSDPENALLDVRRGLALAPDDPWLLAALPRLAAALGDHATADAALRTAEPALDRIERADPEGAATLRRMLGGEAASPMNTPVPAASAVRPAVPPPPPSTPANAGGGPSSTGPRRPATPAPASEAAPQAGTPQTLAHQPPAPDPGARRAAEAALREARESQDHERIVAALPGVAELEPDDERRAALFAELGQLLYYELEDPTRALQYLEEAQRLSPEGAGADYGLLSALEAIYEDTASAEGLMTVYRRKLAQAGSEDIRSVYRLLMASVLFEQLGRPSEAVGLLDEVLEGDPRSVPALRLRARIWASAGRKTDAAHAMQSLIGMPEIDPFERQDLLRELGRLEWQGLGKLDRAASRFEALLGEIPGDTDCISSLKQIYARDGRWDGVVDVLRRELGILAGAVDAFASVDDAIDVSPERLPSQLRGTFAQILAEAGTILAERAGDRDRGLRAGRAACAIAPGDVLLHEQFMELALRLEAHNDAVDAALVVAPALVREDARAELVQRVEQAAASVGRKAALLAAAGLGGDAEPDKPAPKAEPRASRMERLDQMAVAGAFAEAIGAIDAWLPSARRPALRRELLLRKGRWLLDSGADAKTALLPLKGALILNPGAAETRLELLRASSRVGDVSQAMDQLNAYLASYNSSDAGAEPTPEEVARLRAALDDLTACQRGPTPERVRALIDANAPWLATLVARRA